MIETYREYLRDFLQENSRTIRISVIFGVCNVILPLVLVTWFFHRATDVRHPFALLSQPRDEVHPWLVFLSFTVLLVIVSLLQIKFFRLSRHDVATYFLPCALTLGFIILNVLVPAWFFGWALQDFADRGLGIYSDKPNPANPMRPYFRLIFAAVFSGLIIATEIVAVRSYLSRQ